jgi:hypothetical protein
MSTDLIRQELGALESGMSVEDAVEYWVRLEALKARVREALADGETMLIEWFKANPGKSFRVGDKLVFLGEKKSPAKPRDMFAAMDALLSKVDGELESFAELLAANALKPGACRKVLGEEFDAYFEVTVAPAVKEGKRPPKGVVVVNTRFVEVDDGD